ncbi:MAG TPA: hypothetical protein VKX30_03730 [Flavobacteriaceae bacterium]|nr:hypothetical protein [Flavobacteriaceae bacterium]
MKKFFLLSLVILSAACTENRRPVSLTEESSVNQQLIDSLAYELCTMYGLDQGIRNEGSFILSNREDILKIDSLNFAKLVGIVKEFGYPNEALFGKEHIPHECVVLSSTAIMLHNPHKIIQDQALFNLFLEEVNKGNLSREFFATILDKYYWSKSRGKRVMYGSSFGVPCIDTKEETNRLRKEIGLEPLKEDEFKECDETI